MAATKTKETRVRPSFAGAEYRGKQTKTGNSSGFRFEGALFRSHPEFISEVTARVFAPGRMLVTVEQQNSEQIDPVMTSFLAFLAQDLANAPAFLGQITCIPLAIDGETQTKLRTFRNSSRVPKRTQ